VGYDEFILPVNQEVYWERDFYNMLWDHNLKDNLYLLLQILIINPESKQIFTSESPEKKEFETSCYAVFKANSEDGYLRLGTFEHQLYRLPISLEH